MLGFEGGQRRGGTTCRALSGPLVPLVGDVKSSPTARGRMLRLERKKQGGERLGRRRTCLEGDGGGTTPSDRRQTCWEGGQEGAAPSDRRRTCSGGGGHGWGVGCGGAGGGGTLGVAVGRLPLTGCTSDPRGRPGRVAAVAGLTRAGRRGGGGVSNGVPGGRSQEGGAYLTACQAAARRGGGGVSNGVPGGRSQGGGRI